MARFLFREKYYMFHQCPTIIFTVLFLRLQRATSCNEQNVVSSELLTAKLKVSHAQSNTLGLVVIKKRKTFFAWVFSELRIVNARVRFQNVALKLP